MDNSSVPDYVTGDVWYCPSIPAGVTSFTVTISGTGSTSAAYLTLEGSEWLAGSIATTGYFESVDQGITSNNTPSSSASVPTSATTTHANDLIVALVVTCGAQFDISPGAGFTGLTVNPSIDAGFMTEAMAVSSTGVKIATASWTGTTIIGNNCQLGDTGGGLDTWYGIITPLMSGSLAPPPVSLTGKIISN
jgi:hypothetical protein